MPRFFIAPPQGEIAVVQGEDAKHIAKVLRMRDGETLVLCDGMGFDYRCEILSAMPGEVVAQVLEKSPNKSEPRFPIRLYQAMPKGEKLDFIVQKAVELGVSEIVPVLSDRCISRPDAKAMGKKQERLQKIALEAAKQSGRGIIPQILPLQFFCDAIAGMKTYGRAILLYERATAPLSALLDAGGAVALMVGSEGGFSKKEAACAQEAGVAAASLGGRILRCETAPICALSAILYANGEF